MWIPSGESDKLANSEILLLAARIRRMFSITPSASLGCKGVAILRTHGLPISKLCKCDGDSHLHDARHYLGLRCLINWLSSRQDLP